MPRDQLSAGREFRCTDNMKQIVEKAGEDGYDFIATYIAHPWCCLDPKNLPEELPRISRPDLVLTSHEWSRLVVAKISPWIDVDSADEHIRKLSEKALRDELSYFSYLCLPAILVELKSAYQSNLAKILNEFAESPGGPVIWAVVPAMGNGLRAGSNGNGDHPNGYLNESVCSGGSGDQDSNGGTGTRSNSDCDEEEYQNENDDPWVWFHTFRTACDNKARIGLVLRIGADLPAAESKRKRWLGEPMKAFMIDSNVFMTNDRRFPVLTRAHQTFIKELFGLSIQVIVTGPTRHHRSPNFPRNAVDPNQNQSKTCLYYSYLNHLFKTRPSLDTVSEWALGYEDCLQIPLQPLGDNLESQIYETFEKDPVKYCDYKTAIGAALEFLKTREVDSNNNNKIVIMVLGAGRGPLVSAAIEALNLLSTEAIIYAVEKNPNAVITLNYLAQTKWADRVTVIHSDMRDFHPPEEHKADIVVSELLGSFGDNELSPECLDGALHLMKPECISIPQSYTSFVAPIHSPKLHQTVRIQAAKDPNSMIAFESSYVVRVHNHFLPAAPQPLFSFSHPNFELKTNDRFKELTFVATETCDLAGLVGYFRAQLFTGVSLSIVPESHTPGLFSWFPIFFPFKDPVYVKKGETIVLNFWRCSDSRQVWYEWCLKKPGQTTIMNCRGRSSPIRKL